VSLNAKKYSKEKTLGFTLVEVMVTLTILGFVLLIIFGVFRLGISSWEKGETAREEYQRVRIASQLISQQLKSVIPYKIKSQKAEGDYLAFEGSAKTLKFVSTLSLKARKPSGFIYATYEFQEGERNGGRLVHHERRVVNKNFMEEVVSEDVKIPLFEGLAEVRFEYFQEEDAEKDRAGGWVEEWDVKEEKELPKALRVTIVPRRGETQKEEAPIVILASLPSNRYEEVRTAPVRRTVPSTPR
jgi:general secretion pathway protein J